MDNEKKTLIMSTIATIALIAIVIGATYAYFEAQNEASGGSNIGVDAATTDVFRLTSSEKIELNANPSNFKQGDANLVGEAQASAYLRANNNTNTATYNYYVYLDIEENDFVYSVDSNTPELLLKVYEGEIGENEITSIPGLTRKTTEDVTGFDITGITRAITLVNNKEITTTSEIEEKWSIEIIFVNLESDQLANQGKTLNASLRIESDSIGAQITEVTTSEITQTTITVNAEVETGESEVITYIYGIKESSDDTTAMVGSESLRKLADGDVDEEGYATYERTTSTYTFENLKSGTKYDIKISVKDNKGLESQKIIKKIRTLIPTSIAEVCESNENLATCIKKIYFEDGENNLYYHDGSGDYTNADLEAGDNSYRYAGAHDSVNNFVCFGTDEETCPDANLYRIIGVFGDQVKLIKWDYATNDILGTETYSGSDWTPSVSYYKGCLTSGPYHYWSGSSSTSSNNIWSESIFNTTALNTNYLNYLDADDSKWRSMIAMTEWQQGGMTNANVFQTNAKTTYNYELGANKITGTFTNDCDGNGSGTTMCEYDATTNAKVGLMYVSEYYYAATPTYWSYVGNNSSDATKDYRAATSSNWMYMGFRDWTISRSSDYSYTSFTVHDSGLVGYNGVNTYFAVRPSFSLESSVKYLSGDGTKNSPYRVGI
ncbi:MAG: hypothetical protein E7172_02165 [Firmicutes bacterium]|nr:hypothetical protein [Bacillota bacterium]